LTASFGFLVLPKHNPLDDDRDTGGAKLTVLFCCAWVRAVTRITLTRIILARVVYYKVGELL